MMDFRLQDNDLADFALTDSLEQRLKIALQTLQGEWFLDQNVGIPYRTQLLGQKVHPLTVLGIFREAILKVPGVIEITRLELQGSRLLFEVKSSTDQTVTLDV